MDDCWLCHGNGGRWGYDDWELCPECVPSWLHPERPDPDDFVFPEPAPVDGKDG